MYTIPNLHVVSVLSTAWERAAGSEDSDVAAEQLGSPFCHFTTDVFLR